MASKPILYIAISPQLFEEIELNRHLPRLAEAAQIERWPGPGSPTQEAIRAALERAEILLTGWGTPSLAPLLQDWSPQRSPLRLVAHCAGTIKHLLAADLLERGLLVTHANEALAEAVAEFTMGAFIAMRRQIVFSVERFRQGKPALPFTTMRELPGSVVGIIGASAIGRRVMELLRPWKVTILLYDPYFSAESAAAFGAQKVDLLTLMRESDIVSLHAPITPETIHMLRAEHFAAMKDGALFVNTARGVLVDHDALLRELQTGRIYALLDVTDPTEPLPRDSPFFQLDNCAVLPHIAGASLEARRRQGDYVAQDILHYLQNEPLRFRVLPERWQTMA